MKKLLFSFLLLSSFLNADIVYNVSLLGTKNKCIFNDYYVKNGRFYYRYLTSPYTWRSTTSKKYNAYLTSGYQFDNNNSVCEPEHWLIAGMNVQDWHFLEALTGLLFGFVFMIFTIYLFVTVGGKR